MARKNALRLALGIFIAIAALFPFSIVSAEQTCTPDPYEAVCMGDSGEDPYAACDGEWVDAYAPVGVEVQICQGYDGLNYYLVCAPVLGCRFGTLPV